MTYILCSEFPGSLHGDILKGCLHRVAPDSSLRQKQRNYSTPANNTAPPRWMQLEPELDEALVPRKLSVSPLESWLSLRYSLPPLLEAPQPQEDVGLLEEKVLPPISVPVMEDENGSAAPLSCKNVLKIRRRKMNRHKYKKLQKRIKFLRKRVLEGRGKKKQVSSLYKDQIVFMSQKISHCCLCSFQHHISTICDRVTRK